MKIDVMPAAHSSLLRVFLCVFVANGHSSGGATIAAAKGRQLEAVPVPKIGSIVKFVQVLRYLNECTYYGSVQYNNQHPRGPSIATTFS